MRPVLTILTLLMLAHPLAAPAQETAKLPDADYEAFTERAITGYIRPAMNRFAEATGTLERVTSGSCTAVAPIQDSAHWPNVTRPSPIRSSLQNKA